MVIPPKYAVSKAVETIKKYISRSLQEKFRFLDDKGIWRKGYFVSTVGKRTSNKRIHRAAGKGKCRTSAA